jgi:prolyl-tRNA synthetase
LALVLLKARGSNIRIGTAANQFAHTTSWGVSTRLIGGVIMTHGDDDGLRCPPQIAPHQIIIVPMLRDNDEDDVVLGLLPDPAERTACALSAFGEPLRVLLDTKATKASNKRWSWVKKGAPVIVEVGPRDVSGRQGRGHCAVTNLYKDDGKLATAFTPRACSLLRGSRHARRNPRPTLYALRQSSVMDANIRRDVTDLATHFAGDEAGFAGWVEVQWARPTGAALDKIVEQLKALKADHAEQPSGCRGRGWRMFLYW